MRKIMTVMKSFQIENEDLPTIGLLAALVACVITVWYSLWQAFQ